MIDLLPELVQVELARAANAVNADDKPKARLIYRSLVESLGDDDLSAAVVLHVEAVIVEDLSEKLALNLEAKRRADRSARWPEEMRPSLLANIGYCHLATGQLNEAEHWYRLALQATSSMPLPDAYTEQVTMGIEAALKKIGAEREG